MSERPETPVDPVETVIAQAIADWFGRSWQLDPARSWGEQTVSFRQLLAIETANAIVDYHDWRRTAGEMSEDRRRRREQKEADRRAKSRAKKAAGPIPEPVEPEGGE